MHSCTRRTGQAGNRGAAKAKAAGRKSTEREGDGQRTWQRGVLYKGSHSETQFPVR